MSEDPSELLVISDVDGCLVARAGDDFEAARPALAALAAHRIPLVLASTRTRAEMEPFGRVLGLGTPVIIENGSALLLPDGHLARAPDGATLSRGCWTLALGPPRSDLAAALEEIARETGADVKPATTLTDDDLLRLTGLKPARVELALQREYDEPFVLADESLGEAIAEAARERGLRLSRNGSFWHLAGDTDLGRALLVLLGLYSAEGKRPFTVGLGSSGNHLPLLRVVHRPIVLPLEEGGVEGSLITGLPGAETAHTAGPAGWNAAILTVLGGGRLPQG